MISAFNCSLILPKIKDDVNLTIQNFLNQFDESSRLRITIYNASLEKNKMIFSVIIREPTFEDMQKLAEFTN